MFNLLRSTIMGIVIYILITICTSAAAQEHVVLTTTEVFSHTLNVSKEPINLKTDQFDAVFLVATWCPYSDEFIKALKHPMLASEVYDKNFAFLVADEWPTVRKQFEESGDYSVEELDTFQLSVYATEPFWLTQPEKIEEYPGTVFIFPENPNKIPGSSGFPAGYEESRHDFERHATEVLQELGISKWKLGLTYNLIDSSE